MDVCEQNVKLPSPVDSVSKERIGYQTSPHAPNTPENNVCKLVTYRGAKVASFTVNGKELICLPQAFELFLKHLVGGLHTVYTKLKRLEITPVVCNVEQVRILRGVAAIQPGVNRCKLISPQEFDVLYDDCTSNSARPGRPPKRSSFISELSNDEMTPNKLIRKDIDVTTAGFSSYDDMKNLSPTSVLPQNFLPPFSNCGTTIPNLPLVSAAYPHINWIHQAAIQMAVANQLQSNLNRSQVEPYLPLNLLKPALHLQLNSNQSQQPTSQLPQQMFLSNSARLQNRESDEKDKLHVNVKAFASTDELKISVSPKYTSHTLKNQQNDTPAIRSVETTSPDQNAILTPPLSSPTEHTDRTEQVSVSVTGDEREATPHVQIDQDNNETDVHSKNYTESQHNKDEVEKLLSSLINELRSFVDSVLQQQEDIISYIEEVRDDLRSKGVQTDVLDKIKKHQRDTSQFMARQLSIQSHNNNQVSSLLERAKSVI